MKTKTLTHAIRSALVAGCASTLVMAAPVMADDEEGLADLDRVQVTGSRIKRADMEAALPVTVIDREQIDHSGEISVAELLNSSPFNSFGSVQPRSGTGAQAFAGLSLRGLGMQRTVVLIDGRRAPRSPLTGGFNDLNLIPLAAVERIEILSDGASAIYGADAIGGVVNIITRSDYDGMQFRLGMSDPAREGGTTREGHIVWGTTGDWGRALAGVSRSSRGMVYAQDRPWSAGPMFSAYSNNYGRVGIDAEGNPTPLFALIGSAKDFHPDDIGCGDIGGGFLDGDGLCFYDYTLVSADEAATTNESIFVTGEFDLNHDWRISSRASYTRADSFGRYAPAPEAIFLDADSPANHYGEAVYLWHRFDALGPRDTYTQSHNTDLTINIEGHVGQFDLDFGLRANRNDYNEDGYNFLSIPVATRYINEGIYDPYRPHDNPQEVLDAMKATTGRSSHYDQDELYGLLSTELFDLPAGPIAIALGAEWRQEEYADIYDQQSAAGNVGGSSGNSSAGERTQRSVYFEALAPLADKVELNLAGRYDAYSDFDGEFSPKLALRYQPLDNLTVRGSWGRGYRAPTLDILNQQPAFSADFIIHAPSCEAVGLTPPCVTQTNAYRMANPDLLPEKSEQFSFGVAFEPFDWLYGTLDYYNIEVTDSVIFLNADQVIGREENGLYLPDFMYSERTEEGQVIRVFTGSFNEGMIETDGLDLNLNAHFDLGNMGRMHNNLQLNHVRSFHLNGGPNLAGATTTPGGPSRPSYNGMLSTVWSYSDFSVAWNVNWIDSLAAEFTIVDGEIEKEGKTASWLSHDVQATWFAPWNAELTLGVRNLTDRDPSLNDAMSRGYDMDLYDPWGRVSYIRYTQNF